MIHLNTSYLPLPGNRIVHLLLYFVWQRRESTIESKILPEHWQISENNIPELPGNVFNKDIPWNHDPSELDYIKILFHYFLLSPKGKQNKKMNSFTKMISGVNK